MMIPHLRTARIAALVAIAACSPATPSRTPSPVGAARGRYVVVPPTEPREQTADQQVRHVLDRLAFGARPGDVARFARWASTSGSRSSSRPTGSPTRRRSRSSRRRSRPITCRRATSPRCLGRASRRSGSARDSSRQQGDSSAKRDVRAEVLRDDPQLREQLQRARRSVTDVQSVKLARAVASERQLEEVMVDFWENHFTVFAGKGQTRLFLADVRSRRDSSARARQVPRPARRRREESGDAVLSRPVPEHGGLDAHAAGRRRADARRARMQRARPRSSAAGTARQRTRARPERELRARADGAAHARRRRRLHAEGRDRGRARAHGMDDESAPGRRVQLPSADPRRRTRRRCSATSSPAGRGIEDGEEVLDIVARSPATAQFIARKLARPIRERRSADGARRSRGAHVLEDRRRHPRDGAHDRHEPGVLQPRRVSREGEEAVRARGVGAARASARQPDTTPRTAQVVARLGQPIFGHQAPDGWPETGRRVDEHGRDPQPHQLRARARGGSAARREPRTVAGDGALRGASREQQVDAVVGAMLGGQVVAGDAADPAERREPARREARRDSVRQRGDDTPPRRRTDDDGERRCGRWRAGSAGAGVRATGAARRDWRRSSGWRSARPSSSGAERTTNAIITREESMDRRVFMKSGAMALVTMGLSPSFLRRTVFGAELLQRRGARTATRAARC